MQLEGDILASVESFYQIASPRSEVIDVSRNRVEIISLLAYLKRSLPAIVAQRLHFDAMQLTFALMPEQEMARNSIMPVAENVSFHSDKIANNAFDWEPACVDLRINAIDHYAFSSIYRLRHDQPFLLKNGHTTARKCHGRQNLSSNKMPVSENSFVAIRGFLNTTRGANTNIRHDAARQRKNAQPSGTEALQGDF